MLFEEWDDEKWKVLVRKGFGGSKSYHLKGPSTTFVFNEHDFLQLHRNISSIAENIHEKEPYFIHDGTIINREIGTQLLGIVDDCEELNRLYKENNELKSEKIELLEENITYKNAYLAMKDLERENEQLKSKITRLHQLIKNAYESERTDLGKSVLKQLLNQMNG